MLNNGAYVFGHDEKLVVASPRTIRGGTVTKHLAYLLGWEGDRGCPFGRERDESRAPFAELVYPDQMRHPGQFCFER